MTTREHIKRARWCLDSIEAKLGAHEVGPLRVALVDALSLATSVAEIVSAVARKVGER